MKKSIILGISCALALSTLQAQAHKVGNLYVYEDFKQGLQAANTSRKWCLVMLSATWCGPCHNLESQVMTTAPVQTFLSKNFIVTKLDIDKPEGAAIKKKATVEAIPALVIYNSSGTIKAVREGAPGDASSFIAALSEMVTGR